jgi:hypothetical protein
MIIKSKRVSALALLILLPLLASATSQSDNVKRLGKTAAEFKNARVRAAVDWIDLALHPQKKWAFFEVWIMPMNQKSIEIRRENITLILPDGSRLSLPEQGELTAGLPEIRRVMAMTDVPIERIGNTFRPRRSTQRFGFHEASGAPFMVFDSCTVGQLSAAYGDVFFANPSGAWQNGTYRLEIKNGEIDVAIPFSIGSAQEK